MPNFVLHTDTTQRLAQFGQQPGHALLIIGPSGIGKGTIARTVAATITTTTPEAVDNHPYIRILKMDDKARSISIETVRELEHFLTLKVPGDAPRVVIIEDAHGLTTEAQNALLKTLEEPVAHTTIILTAAGEQSLLPTIRSRAATITVKKPLATELETYFQGQGYDLKDVRQAHLMSGGLPGLMSALLNKDTTHPLVEAVTTARAIIQKSTFERLAMVDVLAKDREHCLNTLAILQQMAHVSMASGNNAKTWQRILQHCYQATDLLLASSQPKLTLTNLMLSL
jgi:replication-associated recombination protein RarA